jgi:hypothetical protein
VRFKDFCFYNLYRRKPFADRPATDQSNMRFVCDANLVSVERVPGPSGDFGGGGDQYATSWRVSLPMSGRERFLTFGVWPVLPKGIIETAGSETNKSVIVAKSGAHQVRLCDESMDQDKDVASLNTPNGFIGRFDDKNWWYGYRGGLAPGRIPVSDGFCLTDACRPSIDQYWGPDKVIAAVKVSPFESLNLDGDFNVVVEASFCVHRPPVRFGDVVAIDALGKPRRVVAYAISPQKGNWANQMAACSVLNQAAYAKELIGAATWEPINHMSLDEYKNAKKTQSSNLAGKAAIGSRLHSVTFVSEQTAANNFTGAQEESWLFYNAGFPEFTGDDVPLSSFGRQLSRSDAFAPLLPLNGAIKISSEDRGQNAVEAGDFSLSSNTNIVSSKKAVHGEIFCAALGATVSKGIIGVNDPVVSALPSNASLPLRVVSELSSSNLDSLKVYLSPDCSNNSILSQDQYTVASSDVIKGNQTAIVTIKEPTDRIRYYGKTDDEGAICQFLTEARIFSPCQSPEDVMGTLKGLNSYSSCVRDTFKYESSESTNPDNPSAVEGLPASDHMQILYSKDVMGHDAAAAFCRNSDAMGFKDWQLQGALDQQLFYSSLPSSDQMRFEGQIPSVRLAANQDLVAVLDWEAMRIGRQDQIAGFGYKNYSGMTSIASDGDTFLIVTNQRSYNNYQPICKVNSSLLSCEVMEIAYNDTKNGNDEEIMGLQTAKDGSVFAMGRRSIFRLGKDESQFKRIYYSEGTMHGVSAVGENGALYFVEDRAGFKIMKLNPDTYNLDLSTATVEASVSTLPYALAINQYGAILIRGDVFYVLSVSSQESVGVSGVGIITADGAVRSMAPAGMFIANYSAMPAVSVGQDFYLPVTPSGSRFGTRDTVMLKVSVASDNTIIYRDITTGTGVRLGVRSENSWVGGPTPSMTLTSGGFLVLAQYLEPGADWRAASLRPMKYDPATDRWSTFGPRAIKSRDFGNEGVGMAVLESFGTIRLSTDDFQSLKPDDGQWPSAWVSKKFGQDNSSVPNLSAPIFLDADAMALGKYLPTDAFYQYADRGQHRAVCIRNKNTDKINRRAFIQQKVPQWFPDDPW